MLINLLIDIFRFKNFSNIFFVEFQIKLRETWLKEKLSVIESDTTLLDFLPVRELNTNIKRIQGLEASVKAQVSELLLSPQYMV